MRQRQRERRQRQRQQRQRQQQAAAAKSSWSPPSLSMMSLTGTRSRPFSSAAPCATKTSCTNIPRPKPLHTEPLRCICTANRRPCQNDAHKNGTSETRLSSPEESANVIQEREGPCQHVTCGRSCDHESVMRAAQRTHADECCGRAGVQRGM